MSNFLWPIIKPTIRHFLQAAGGALATYGAIEGNQVEAFVGIGTSLATWGWFMMNQKAGK